MTESNNSNNPSGPLAADTTTTSSTPTNPVQRAMQRVAQKAGSQQAGSSQSPSENASQGQPGATAGQPEADETAGQSASARKAWLKIQRRDQELAKQRQEVEAEKARLAAKEAEWAAEQEALKNLTPENLEATFKKYGWSLEKIARMQLGLPLDSEEKTERDEIAELKAQFQAKEEAEKKAAEEQKRLADQKAFEQQKSHNLNLIANFINSTEGEAYGFIKDRGEPAHTEIMRRAVKLMHDNGYETCTDEEAKALIEYFANELEEELEKDVEQFKVRVTNNPKLAKKLGIILDNSDGTSRPTQPQLAPEASSIVEQLKAQREKRPSNKFIRNDNTVSAKPVGSPAPTKSSSQVERIRQLVAKHGGGGQN